MPRIEAVWHLTGYRAHLRRVPRLTRAHARRRMSYWGRIIITDIRRHASVFKYKGGRSRKGARLINSMWTKRGKPARHEVMQHVGWGVPHGEVLEFGPRRKMTWVITPKGFRSDKSHGRSGGGVALRALRFKWRGKITYMRRVKHRWSIKESRVHVEPALKRNERKFQEDMGSILQRVVQGELR